MFSGRKQEFSQDSETTLGWGVYCAHNIFAGWSCQLDRECGLSYELAAVHYFLKHNSENGSRLCEPNLSLVNPGLESSRQDRAH